MTPSKWRALSTGAFCVSVALLISTFVLPLVRSPQAANYVGPSNPYANSSTMLSGFFIPPVNRGDQIKITVSNFSQRSILITLFPASPGNIAPAGPLLLQEAPTGTNFSTTVESTGTQPYGLYVVSYNMTSFNLRIESIWSPYHIVDTYTVPAVFLVLATAVAVYYYTYAEKRWRIEQNAVQGSPQ
jgi:hypothetical protein